MNKINKSRKNCTPKDYVVLVETTSCWEDGGTARNLQRYCQENCYENSTFISKEDTIRPI
jgi:hypothetical protein